MLNLRQLKYFVTVVEQGSVTKASQTLGIAQPSVGLQIRKLEEDMLVQVLVRNSSGVAMTKAGEMLYERSKQLLAEVQLLERDLQNFASVPVGRVRLGVTPSVADRLLIPLIKRVQEEYPSVQLNLTEDLSHNLTEQVESGQLDLAVAFDVPAVRSLKLTRLASEEAYLICLGGEGEEDHSPITFREVADYPLILPRWPHRIRVLAERVAQKEGLELHVNYEMQSLSSIMRMVENGLGATVLAGATTSRKLPNRTMIARPIREPTIEFDISLIHSDSHSLSRAETAVVQILTQLVRQFFE